jgi:protein-S-isoprenylcysteine O-methyltransferase Ste14
MIALRLSLLAGLIAHKVVWEVLKRRQGHAQATEHLRGSVRPKLVKAVKVCILIGIVGQTLAPDILPISTEPLLLRLVGVVVYTAGLLTAIGARLQLGANWSDIETAQVFNQQNVVSHGLYRYIRHPIYVADLLLLLGLELSLNSWLVVVVGVMIPVVLRRAVHEERMLVQSLPGYALYCAQTKRFIPFVV